MYTGMTEDEKMQLAAKKMQEKFQAEAEGRAVSFPPSYQLCLCKKLRCN